MKNFKPGQKVVFKKMPNSTDDINCISPKENEIVTIIQNFPNNRKLWFIEEYQKSKCNKIQLFIDDCLFPLEEITKEETKKILADLENKFIPERDLILN